jgi:ATP-binding cassette subfamily G (WHITE) protein 2 (SNQ2)
MWGSNVDERKLHRSNTGEGPQSNQWHTQGDRQRGADRLHPPREAEESPDDADRAGTFGENDAGRFTEEGALEDFRNLRQNLNGLERTRTQDTQTSAKSRRKSGVGRSNTRNTARTDATGTDAGDVEATAGNDEDEFQLEEFMKEGHFEKRTDGRSAKKVGVIFKDLNVQGTGGTATFARTLPDSIIGTFGPQLWAFIRGYIPALARRKGDTRTLIHDFNGCVRDGEMMLVLGRPGSGCSTFLKAVTNNRDTYASVTGDVHYGGISAEKQKKMYRGEVAYK